LKDRQKFRPEQRLRNQDSFKNLVEKGRFAKGRFFYVWTAASDKKADEGARLTPALGVVVNKKTQALATDRNTLKRRMREVFRKRQNELKEGAAILIKAREGSPLPDFQNAEKELMELFKKTGALK